MENYPPGTRVIHKKFGKGIVQETYKVYHTNLEKIGMGYVKFDSKPPGIAVDVILVFFDELTKEG